MILAAPVHLLITAEVNPLSIVNMETWQETSRLCQNASLLKIAFNLS